MLLAGLENDIVDYIPNFDNSQKEPALLPAPIPNLLFNGASGIAVVSFQVKKTAAEKAYVAELCRILVLLHFRVSEQEVVKLMQMILSRVSVIIAAENDLKELRHVADRLKSVNRHLSVSKDILQNIQILRRKQLKKMNRAEEYEVINEDGGDITKCGDDDGLQLEGNVDGEQGNDRQDDKDGDDEDEGQFEREKRRA